MTARSLLEVRAHVIAERAMGLLLRGGVGDVLDRVGLRPRGNQRLLGHETRHQRARQGPRIEASRGKGRGDDVRNRTIGRILRRRRFAPRRILRRSANRDGHEQPHHDHGAHDDAAGRL